MRIRGRTAGVLLAAFVLAGGCQREQAEPPPAPPAAEPPALGAGPAEYPGLQNVIRVTDKLISGSGPEGDEGFRSLRELGVRTAISVDGARPEVELAHKYGLRYAHLPIGYDGVPREQALRIARAVRDLPGLVYLHCHHGLHRGPAAAAAAWRCLDGTCPAARATDFLRRAGTDPRYAGLYATVERLAPPTAAELDRVSPDFPEVSPPAGLTRLMVDVDARWDRLKLAKAAGWAAPKDHPDVDPPHEALQLTELFKEAARLPPAGRVTPEVVKVLGEAEAVAAELEHSLRSKPVVRAEADRAFGRAASVCSRCHAKYRD